MKGQIENPELDKLFEKYRRSPESFVFAPLADACRKLGRLEEALEICTRGLKLHPNYPTGHVVMGKCLFDLGRRKEALESFRRVLTLDSENLVALKYVGMISAEIGEADEARESFRKILALDPDNKEIGDRLKELEAREEEFLELKPMEEEDFEGKEIKLGDDDVETSDELATVTLADIFAAQGYREKAMRIYREVLSKDPGNEAVRRKIEALTRGDRREPTLEKVVESDLSLEEEKEDKPAEPAGNAAPGGPSSGKSIDERESLEHFRRWLEKMGE